MPETIFLFVYNKQGDLLMAAYLFSENQGVYGERFGAFGSI